MKSNGKLLPGILEYSRLVNANTEDPSSGPINSVQFHINAQLLLTDRLDRKLTFFQIDGKRNTKIQSIFLEDCPIQKASFVPDGSQVIAAGRRSNLLQKISWISQNVRPKDQIEKIKRKASKKPLLLKDDGELEERKEDKPDTYKTKKRKEEHVEEDKQLEIEQENEMKKLEKFLFGSLYSPVEFGKQHDEESRDEIIEKSSVLFFTDRSTNSVLSIYENDAEFPENTDEEDGVRQRKPVWVDEQEEKININIARANKLRKLRKEENESVISSSSYVSRLRAQHVKLNSGTEWAQLDLQSRTYSFDDKYSDVENGPVGPALGPGYKEIVGIDDILRTNEDLVMKSNAKLLPRLLEYSRLVNANAEDPSCDPINSVQFHRNTRLLLTGRLDRKLTFF
ncbi:hypothetical protein U1Q18_039994 [Sarracenia purpurea var. burkii]